MSNKFQVDADTGGSGATLGTVSLFDLKYKFLCSQESRALLRKFVCGRVESEE